MKVNEIARESSQPYSKLTDAKRLIVEYSPRRR
jgi:hypothetical protein